MKKEADKLTKDQWWYVKLVIGLLAGWTIAQLIFGIGIVVLRPFLLPGLTPQELAIKTFCISSITQVIIFVFVAAIVVKKL